MSNNVQSNNQNSKEDSKEDKKYIKKIFWIDEKVNENYNKKYQQKLKDKFNLELKEFEDFQKGFDEIKNLGFEFIYLIISGKYFQTYVESIDSNLETLKTIPITIIFTSKYFKDYLLGKKEDKQFQLKKKTLEAIRNPLYDLGYVTINVKEIIKFIENFENNLTEKFEETINFKRDFKSELTFERVNSIQNLILPSLYNQIEVQDLNIYKTDIDEMNRHIFSNYRKKDIFKILLPLFKFNINIPPQIMSKIWVYIYTCQCNFYRDMNQNLMAQKNLNLYNYFIKMLYKGLKIKTLKTNCKSDLYRCSFMKKEEIEDLKNIVYKPPSNDVKENDNIDVCLVYSRAFLSFSKNKDQALKFLKENKNEDLVSCIFEVNGLEEENKEIIDENETFSSNAEIKDFSRFKNEDEVLFFPFSSFIISEIEDSKEKNIEVKRITLEYLGKFRKQINSVIQKINIAKLLEEKNKSKFLEDIKKNMENHIKEEKKDKIKKKKKNTNDEEMIDINQNNPILIGNNEEIELPLSSVNKIKQIINEKIENVIEDKKYQLNIHSFKKDKFIEFKSKPNTLKFEERLEDVKYFNDYSDDQFCLFNSINEEILLVYIKGEDKDKKNSLGCYNFKTSNDQTIENVHKKNILVIKHYIKNNEDLILTTSYDNALKILSITKDWNCIFFIENIGKNEGLDDNYYLYSASLLTIENEEDYEKNEDFIIATCYNDDEIKIYDYKTKKLREIESRYGFIFSDTYYDENLKEYFIICSNFIDSGTNEKGIEEKCIKIYNFKTGEIYFEVEKFAHNVIISKSHNYNEENKNSENLIENFEKNNVSIIFASENKIYVYDFYSKNLLKEIKIESVKYLHCICLWNKDYIIVGGDKKDNKIHVIDLKQNKEIHKINGYNVFSFAKIKIKDKKNENNYYEKLYSQELENKGIINFKTFIDEDK